MPEIGFVIDELRNDNSIYDEANDPGIQFVNRNDQPLVGAQVLPEQLQDNNMYASESVGFLDVVADDADRYSPPRFKGQAARVSAMEVMLGELNIGQRLWAAEYDRLLALMASANTMEQMADIVLDFVGTMARGFASKAEIQRWSAIVNGSVVRIIRDSRSLINYPSADGQRGALVPVWSTQDPATAPDPMETFTAAEDFAAEHGYAGISRIVTSTFGARTLARNPFMKSYVYGDNPARRVSVADVNGYLQDEGFPAVETYDTRWYDEGSVSGRYLPEDAIVFFFNVGGVNQALRDWIDGTDPQTVRIPDGAITGGAVPGRYGIGTPGGFNRPGRAIEVWQPDGFPKSVNGAGAQTSLPVLDHPHGFFVRTGIR